MSVAADDGEELYNKNEGELADVAVFWLPKSGRGKNDTLVRKRCQIKAMAKRGRTCGHLRLYHPGGFATEEKVS